ncbi:SDR family oxidoreductase [Nocardia vinacea]|uniref:SDR family oxidoreductase n=1 Tax=Nocardia vinacea TaxID=96468 RepID=A0ABZ1YU05_9NOCA|nr:SDR family NAD(P)-dependent oxidoreductase [Nocardia vinacea]
MVEQVLASRVAVVMGCARGIGARTAEVLAERGAAIVLADIDEAAVVANAKSLVHQGYMALALSCDIRDERAVERVMNTAVAQFGRLDILHNNAAAMHLIANDGDVLSMDMDLWDQTLAVNLRGQLLAARAALPHMLAQGRGCIVNMASVAGLQGDLVLTAYGASKAAVGQLTLSIATQYGRRGIRCNAVVPGLIRVIRPTGGLPEEALRAHLRHQLLDVVGEPDDIATAVAFLASDDARFVTGQLLTVDGGLTAHASSFAEAYEASQRIGTS